jgi:hypothetical protein
MVIGVGHEAQRGILLCYSDSSYWGFNVMEYLNKGWTETMIAEVQKNKKLFSLPRFIGPTRFQLTSSEMQ